MFDFEDAAHFTGEENDTETEMGTSRSVADGLGDDDAEELLSRIVDGI